MNAEFKRSSDIVLTNGVTSLKPVLGSPIIEEVGVVSRWNNPPF